MKRIEIIVNILIAWIILTLSDAAASEIAYGIVYIKWNSLTLNICLYSLLAVAFVIGSVSLYTKYVLKSTTDQFYMSTKLKCASNGTDRWYVISLLLPIILSILSIIFTQGSFQNENLSGPEIIYAICWTIFSGLRRGIIDGILLRGLVMASMRKAWPWKRTILFSGIIFTVLHFDFADAGDNMGALLLMSVTLLIMGMALAAVTYASGTIWTSVTMYSFYLVLFGRTEILNISTERDYDAIWNYTVKSENWLTVGFSGADGGKVSGLVLLAFLIVLIMAVFQVKDSDASIRGF
ncbi:MAG: CPBP family intramembrane metalloprotease [Clostridiales bacterium]|nr:CPBP family intramembrane metalloprotease [Clostridiales bacterium]